MKSTPIPIQYVQQNFKLDDGKLFRLIGSKWRLVEQSTTSKYTQIWIHGKQYQMHRLIYALANGECPVELLVDHVDGNPANNHPDNLKLATHRQNAQNKVCHRDGRMVGTFYRKRTNDWLAVIKINCQRTVIGAYPTMELAHEAYMKAAAELG